MLTELKIENFVLVDKINVSFDDKLTVLSGETGAGKSVLVGAINLVLGGQVRGNIFLDNSKSVLLEASFTRLEYIPEFNELISKYEIDMSDGELFFRRDIKPDGKSSIFINGRKSTNSIVKEFRSILLDFHSQRDQQLLFDEEVQINFLDEYAELLDLRSEFNEKYQKLQYLIIEAKRQKEEIKRLQDKKLLYEYQINELETANLSINEESDLDNEYQVLLNAKEILGLFETFNQEFFENENTIYDKIKYYQKSFEEFKNSSKLIDNVCENLITCSTALEDVMQTIRFIDQEIVIDEKRLDTVEARIKVLFDLKTKYRKDISELMNYILEMKEFIRNFNQNIKKNDNIDKEIKSINLECIRIAELLSVKRKQSAINFEKLIVNNLKDLAIKDATFKIIVDKISSFDLNSVDISKFNNFGCDRVSFQFSANKGMQIQDLKFSISGGELSRLLLVIKSILANKLPEKTVVFDEIDTGIGGNTANMLGQFIRELSNNQQIICITHLPQIASLGHNHFKIEKKLYLNKNSITIAKLNEEDRIIEIARMLSGDITEVSKKHAIELLNKL
ncbi:MAG: DNA repair protein RecN [Candidatus Cloacimonetes bacterium]|jgi:DNA repair protein RecN (Recombination protein N)|nr:DNA repair protein RecN [Candidatus Cloacimonadota bacterium]